MKATTLIIPGVTTRQLTLTEGCFQAALLVNVCHRSNLYHRIGILLMIHFVYSNRHFEHIRAYLFRIPYNTRHIIRFYIFFK